jgi:hypothetical protein
VIAMSNTQHIDELCRCREAAHSAGLPWSAVVDRFRDLWQNILESREHERELRRTAWACFNAHRPRKWEFWRHGFRSQYGHRYFSRGVEAIRGWDKLAKEIGSIFPEWEDRASELWEFLMHDCERLPDRAQIYWRAFRELQREQFSNEHTTEHEYHAIEF